MEKEYGDRLKNFGRRGFSALAVQFNLEKTRSVKALQCLRFVHFGLRSILVLFEKAQMGEDEVLVNFYIFFLCALTVGASPCNARIEETAINKLNTASSIMEKARGEAKDMTLPVNKYAEEGLKAAEECAEIFYSPEFQQEIICEQQRLEREVFREYTASWKKKKQRPATELAEQNDCLSDTEKVYLFFSSSVPDETAQAYIADIARANDPNVIPVMRGFVKGLADIKVSTKYFSRILQKD